MQEEQLEGGDLCSSVFCRLKLVNMDGIELA